MTAFFSVPAPFNVFTGKTDNFLDDGDLPATMRPVFSEELDGEMAPATEIEFTRGKRVFSIVLTIADLLALAGQVQIALDDLEAEADVCDDPSCAMCNEDPTDEQILEAAAEFGVNDDLNAYLRMLGYTDAEFLALRDAFAYVPEKVGDEDPNCCDEACLGCDGDCPLCRDGCPCLIDLDALIFALARL